jgi:hypothetical protein
MNKLQNKTGRPFSHIGMLCQSHREQWNSIIPVIGKYQSGIDTQLSGSLGPLNPLCCRHGYAAIIINHHGWFRTRKVEREQARYNRYGRRYHEKPWPELTIPGRFLSLFHCLMLHATVTMAL